MFRLALRNLFSRKLRFALTALAIVLGTAMISGTYVLTDQISGAFRDIFAKANSGVDVVVTKKQAFQSQQGAQSGSFSDQALATVRAVPGVDVAEGLIGGTGSLVVGDRVASAVGGAPSLLVSTTADPRFNAVTYETGRSPTSTGEVSVDVGTADRYHIAVGASAKIATTTGVAPVRIVGTFRFGGSTSLGGTTIVAAPIADVQSWTGLTGRLTSVAVAAAPGADAGQLRNRIAAALDNPDLLIETGGQSADRQTKEVDQNLGFLRTMLLVFAMISVLVGGFVIFNIFSITIAQRIREMAMLRTVGATRGQIRRSVLIEALIVGVVASIIGLVVGVLIAIGLKAAFDAGGFGLPAAGVEVRPRTIVVALLVGIVATVLSAILPAFRATRIPPVAALREGAVLPPSRFNRLAPILGLAAVVLGAAVTLVGMGMKASVTRQLSVIGIGALFIVIGVAMALRIFIRPLARFVGGPFSAMFGKTAELGRQNTIRQPERTASTATALMIGVSLVVFITVFVFAFKNTFFTAIDQIVRADQITITDNFQPMPERSVQVAQRVDGVESAMGIGTVEARSGGKPIPLFAVNPQAARRLINFDWREGGIAALDRLGTDGAIVEEGYARDHSLGVGKTFTVTSIDNVTRTYTIRGIYRDRMLFVGATVSDAALRELAQQPQVVWLMTKFGPGISADAGAAALQRALKAEVPTAKVRTKAQYKEFINTQTTQFLSILYVLLALSVFISLIGVIITLFLAVYERTREVGMMRAVGATRWQIRSMVGFESIITCVIGAIVGVLVGLLLAWLIVLGLRGEGLVFSVPFGTLGIVLVLAFFAGVIASIFPARRAAKLQPLEALHYE